MKDEMSKNVTNDFLLSLAVSFFGLILIFGLGFVFPNINPYSAIKWIVIVSTVFFVYSLVSFGVMKFMVIKANYSMKKGVKKEVKVKKASKK
jgi:hypothetical protein